MKRRIILLLCAALCLSGCGTDDAIEYVSDSGPEASVSDDLPDASGEAAEDGADEENNDGPSEPEPIFVYVCGAVNAPGVYELPAGSRVFDAVDAAGGLTPEADMRTLNQAQLLSDGEQITVYTQEEVSENAIQVSGTETRSDGLVNINLAGKEELMTLPGIGETRADAIIAYREENGAFGKPEDICNVTGIKEKSYEKISSLITV